MIMRGMMIMMTEFSKQQRNVDDPGMDDGRNHNQNQNLTQVISG